MTDNESFFDRQAPDWDAQLLPHYYSVASKILERGRLSASDRVLDVGCGTGILIPQILALGISRENITAIDKSSGMAKAFAAKFPAVKILVDDFERRLFKENSFDAIIIYNAFPHFSNFDRVFDNAFYYLAQSGRLVVAHSLNRAALNRLHRAAGGEVEEDILPEVMEFAQFYRLTGFVDVLVEDGEYFYSHGTKKN